MSQFSCSDRIAYQTYNDVQSINAGRRDMWAVLAEAALDRLERERREVPGLHWDANAYGPLTAATVPA